VTVTAGMAETLPVNPAALSQRVARVLQGRRDTGPTIMLVAGAPIWPHDPVQTTRDGDRYTVVPAASVLAVWEQVVADRQLPCVVLTPVQEEDLGTGLLSRVARRRVLHMEPWSLIADSFGAQRLDPRLEELPWAGPALLEATPPKGWPPLAGTVLQRDIALRYLTVERLDLHRLGVSPDNVDAAALLRWSALPGAQRRLSDLRDPERQGLLTWLAETFGPAAAMVGRLDSADHVADALPLGLLCAALWADGDATDARAQGRIEQYAGGAQLEAAAMQAYGSVAIDTFVALLNDVERQAPRSAGPMPQPILDRAEDLLTMFAARSSAARSMVLPSGFESRLDAAAQALHTALEKTGDQGALAAATRVVDEAAGNLAGHALARIQRHRVERVEMAARLLRWLGTVDAAVDTVADCISGQITTWSWVDAALQHVWTGEDVHAGLAGGYRRLHDRIRERRQAVDEAFAERLAVWAAKPGPEWTVDTVLGAVVEPVVRAGDRGVLFVVLDGMTAAVANEVTAELATMGWQEYDPAGTRTADRGSRRRGVISGLPSVTAVSRTSLLTGALRRGDQDDERAAFEKHRLWQGRKARLFHKNTLYGAAGDVLNPDLLAALSEPDTIVGVVINTVDDALDHGRESADVGWQLNQLGPLRTLLDHASYQGRAVILTSDHGHVLERGGAMRPATAAASARHRTDAADAGEGEVVLAGARVLDGDNRVVALWDEHLRYLPRRAGYHGGASLAEVTVPVIALLPLGAAAPAAWRPLGPQQPRWWDTTGTVESLVTESTPVPERSRRQSRRQVAGQDAALFDLAPTAPPEAVAELPGLVESVLVSEMFRAQHALTPRKLPIAKIRGALSALVDANGTLPAVLVAQRAGEAPTRAGGFLTTLQRIFNVDNFAVLSAIDDGRTARLDLVLLRQQFGVPEDRR
jgi:PglZ domain-containing protein